MRLVGTKQDISYAATLRFFESRGRHASKESPLTATMYQDDALARMRDQCERDTIAPQLNLGPSIRVLDIGCGYGRWGIALKGSIGTYVGVDFSGELLKLAASLAAPGSRFFQLPAQDVSPSTLDGMDAFNLFICAGILIYLNDDDVSRLTGSIVRLAAPNAQVYLREPMAVGDRLTLDRFESRELQQEYSAIYRSEEQVNSLFGSVLEQSGFRLSSRSALYPAELCNRKETEQRYQVWERGQ